MRLSCLLAVVVFTACPLLADEHPQSADHITKKLQGRWEIVGGINQGQDLAVPAIAGTYVTVKLNTITTYDAGEQQRFQAVFRIDESENPVQIMMTDVPLNSPTKSRATDERQDIPSVTASGILKFDGENKWMLCYSLPGADRPQKFASPAGSKTMLFKMERKEAVADPLETLESASGE